MASDRLQLVIAPTAPGGAEPFLLSVVKRSLIEEVRDLVSERIGQPAADIKLVFEGVELPDRASCEACLLRNLSTVQCVVPASAPDGATATRPLSGTAVERAAEGEEADFVSEAEVPCAVVITGLPKVDVDVAHAALFDIFATYGAVQRVITQDDAELEPESHTDHGDDGLESSAPLRGTQHAVLVFGHPSSAAAALAYDRHHILGRPVRVMLATALATDAPAAGDDAGTGTGSRHLSPTALTTVRAVSALLASGFVVGKRGVAHVRRFDAEHGVSDRIASALQSLSSRVGELDQRYGVSRRVGENLGVAAQTLRTIDRDYQVTHSATVAATVAAGAAKEVVGAASAAAQSAASTVAARALENSTVRWGVSALTSALTSATAAVSETVMLTRQQISAREEAEAAAAAAAAASTSAEGATSSASSTAGGASAASGRAVSTSSSAPEEDLDSGSSVSAPTSASAPSPLTVTAHDPTVADPVALRD